MTSADENFKDAPQPSEKHVTKSSETTLNFYHLIVCESIRLEKYLGPCLIIFRNKFQKTHCFQYRKL